MAILEQLPGVEVTVCVDGQPLQEYDDDEEQTAHTVSKYIESTTDKEFEIRYNITSEFEMDCPTLQFRLTVDGKRMSSWIFLHHNYETVKESGSAYIKRVKGPKTLLEGTLFIMPFKFSKIKTTMDDAKLARFKEDAKLFESVGDIRVRVYRKSKAVLSNNQNPRDKVRSNLDSEVHEKALKGQAKSHGIGFGEAKATTPRISYSCDFLDGEDHPIAIFNFKYRSKDALKSLLVIDRTPEPEFPPIPNRSITPVNRPSINVDDLDASQRVKLEEFLQGLVGGERAVKRERDDNGNPGTFQPKRSKTRVTIDLTGDSDEEN